VLDAGHAWTQDPHGKTRHHLAARTPHTDPPLSPPTRAPAAGTRVGQDGPDRTASPRPTPEQVLQDWAATVWIDVGRSIDPRLVTGPDWSGLAAALDRAHQAGYDVHQHLPRLAAQEPLPPDRPARALHYRLVHECEAAITPISAQARRDDDQTREAAVRSRLQRDSELTDNQRRTADPVGLAHQTASTRQPTPGPALAPPAPTEHPRSPRR